MNTLKIKYSSTQETETLISEYQRQYSCVYRWMFNRVQEGVSEKDRGKLVKSLNNIELLDSWFIRSASKEAAYLHKTSGSNVIFGGKKNFSDRCKGNISKEEYKEKRLSLLCSLGEANQHGNRKFQITENLTFIFKPNAKTKIDIKPEGLSKSYRKVLKRLYSLQQSKSFPITYKLSKDYIYITFDESMLYPKKILPVISNRVMAIDLNPNYVGWSIVDWKSSDEYRVIKSGVYSIKDLNDIDFSLKRKKLLSDSKERIYLSNKRHNEVIEVCKNLINKALYYRCETFAVEELKIKSKDSKKGKRYNKLVNNLWCRNKMVDNLHKRCNILNINFIEVKPEYSSFIGNIIFRETGGPDMVLASIEISRRGYEFTRQYIKKDKEKCKNIIQPVITEDLSKRIVKSMEEIGYAGETGDDLVDLYYRIKDSKIRYRVSLDESREFFSCFSNKSLLKKFESDFNKIH